jgi:hypothetical protein
MNGISAPHLLFAQLSASCQLKASLVHRELAWFCLLTAKSQVSPPVFSCCQRCEFEIRLHLTEVALACTANLRAQTPSEKKWCGKRLWLGDKLIRSETARWRSFSQSRRQQSAVYLRLLALPKRCWWKLKSCVRLRRVVWWIAIDVSETHSASIFRVKLNKRISISALKINNDGTFHVLSFPWLTLNIQYENFVYKKHHLHYNHHSLCNSWPWKVYNYRIVK